MNRIRSRLIGILALVLLGNAQPARGQKPDTARRETTASKARRDSTLDSLLVNGITAGEADYEKIPRNLIKRTEFNLGFTTLHIGGGVLFDGAAFSQDSVSAEQFDLDPGWKLRDARFLLGGKFRVKRRTTWQVGVMWDANLHRFLVRQSGVMVAVPEAWGHFFIGRAKEGFSLNKVMTGYDGWTMERMPFTDAVVPLLADGIKWLGYVPSAHWFWNLGLFTDWFSEGQTFSSHDRQIVARGGWVPWVADTAGTLLHVAMNFRAGKVNNDTLVLKSRPESFIAPYFINTGKFPATSSVAFGPELYYRPGRVMIGSEYYWDRVRSPQTGNPWFNGGQVVVSWLTTGETRPYNPAGNYFTAIVPRKTVIEGGPGAWEVVLSFTYSNFTDGPVQGGQFWRFTPMLNWYLTDNLRLEFAYGYGSFNRLGMLGRTQFFQTRFQFEM